MSFLFHQTLKMANKFGHIGWLMTILLAVCPLFAQPRGDEPKKIRRIVDNLHRKIAEKTNQIAEQPAAAKLYAERGALYVELYQNLYHGYYSSFYGEKPPALSILALTSKAIADFGRAIGISPQPLYYGERGEMYAVRWHDAVTKINWNGERQWIAVPEWKDIVPPEREKNELKTFEKFIRNPDFAAARADYEKARAAAADSKTRGKFHAKLARLYLSRAGQIYQNLEYNKNLVVEPNIYGYSLFKELDKGIAELEKSDPAGEDNQPALVSVSWFVTPPPLRQALYFKAEVLLFYGKNALALQTLNAAAKYVDKNKPNDYFICDFYIFRSRLQTANGNFDAAFADADAAYVYENKAPRECPGASEPRGDAYFAKKDFRAAIAAYSSLIELAGYSPIALPRLRHKRARAYLKLGEFKNAVDDLTDAISYDYTPEPYLLRAQAYRGLNDEKKALADEQTAGQIAENMKPKTGRPGIYGKVLLADGSPAPREDAHVMLIYTDGEKENWSPSVDENGRFSFYPLRKPLPFSLFAYFDTEKDGLPVRYYVRTGTLRPKNKLEGPLVLKLERFVRRAAAQNEK
jgi:hypothetical protein